MDEDDFQSPAGGITRLAEHLFRHESGKLVSVLTGVFGLEHLQLAEDVVQEALMRALQTWPYYGVPKNPAAWLTQTAKNLALDVLRRQKRFSDKEKQVIHTMEQWGSSEDESPPAFETEIQDARLRLMFACCHPMLPMEAQTALALKTLCGFSPADIAKAYLTSEAAVAKRLTRARQRIQELGIPFEVPAGAELAPRLDAILQTLYLLFNEGYKASSGETLTRMELCKEAIRLAEQLAAHPLVTQPRVHALLALMLFNTARLPSRTDAEGRLLRLAEQDRSQWNQAMIAQGLQHLAHSAGGEELTAYHLQAAIAACHATAPDDASTDWPRILALYDQLVTLDDSPVIALNRAVAVANVRGPKAGLAAIGKITHLEPLEDYHLFYAVLAELELRQGNHKAASAHLEKAVRLTELKAEQEHLRAQLARSQENLRG